jgi:hypothetical protein
MGYKYLNLLAKLWVRLYLWSKVVGVAIPTIQSVTITHGHLGHIDGIGLFGKEVMGKSGVSLYTNKAVLEKLERSSILYPFNPFHVENGQSVCIGPGIKLEFLRIPHRDFEIGETHAIICRGQDKSFLFLPDHDTWSETLASQGQVSLRCWLQSLEIDFAFIDGTFFVHDEMSGTRKDFTSIPHPSIEETLKLLGAKTEKDPDVYFIHLNHTNSVLTDSTVKEKIRTLGWKLAEQGVLMTL